MADAATGEVSKSAVKNARTDALKVSKKKPIPRVSSSSRPLRPPLPPRTSQSSGALQGGEEKCKNSSVEQAAKEKKPKAEDGETGGR